jgi:predicted dehydrogenase
MKQVVQEVGSGRTTVQEVPSPIAARGLVVVASRVSLVSAGTERYVVDLARKSLIGKAMDRPDQVKRVFEKVRQEGVASTLQQVLAKLDEPMPLGYSIAGVVVESGQGVQEFKPGDRVAAAGPHAGVVAVGHNLCARIPDGVSFEQAAYTSVGSIGLQGVRLAKVALGDRVLVVGLGLIGQIVVALLKANGCRVFGVDLDASRLRLADSMGADATGLGAPLADVLAFTNGQGVDAVVITAATESNGPIEFAAEACRPKGRIVLVGVTGLDIPRPPFFKKELEFTVSSSMGAGRGDPVYEEAGVDYPIGYAKWTVARNMAAVLDTISRGALAVDRLTTHRFPIEQAGQAYDLVTSSRQPSVGILLTYGKIEDGSRRRVELRSKGSGSGLGVSVVGVGNFARLVLLPILKKEHGLEWRGIASAKGMGAVHTGERLGFAFATTDCEAIWKDPGTKVVFVLTRHNLHAGMVIAALRAGKHVFVEKPLCITLDELIEIDQCVRELGQQCPVLMVGFNRRFAKATAKLREHFRGVAPLSISFRFAPGEIPATAWPQDDAIGGGRIVGEACHAIDVCTAVADSVPVRVFAESTGRTGGVETTDDRVFVTVRHANGCIANLSYQAGGDRAGPTERVEVFGGGRTAWVEGWDEVELWARGRRERPSGGKDKGHAAGVHAFLAACRHGGAWPISWEHLRGVTWATLAAVQSLRDGMPQEQAR